MTNSVEEKVLVLFCDGSSRPNPGFGGYGIFGYVLKTAKRPTRTKYPIGTKHNLTTNGIAVQRDESAYETVEIIEYIGASANPEATNNLMELQALVTSLEIAGSIEGLTTVRIFTDSKYTIEGYNTYLDNWKRSNWLRRDGKPVSHRGIWETLDSHKDNLLKLGVTVDLQWVKGHDTTSDNHVGNHIADLYSVAGSNYAKQQLSSKRPGEFQSVVLHKSSDYNEFKNSLAERDLVYYFRDLYFSSANLSDTTFCFLSTSVDESQLGKRDTATIFVVNQGFVPEIVNKTKEVFRAIPRTHVASCCIKIGRLNDDKIMLRLAELVGIDKLLVEQQVNGIARLHLINDPNPFVVEFTKEYPYVVEAGDIFSSTMDAMQLDTTNSANMWSVDVTDLFVDKGKLKITNKDKQLDLSDKFNVPFKFVSKLIATIGKDVPQYLTLKHMEDRIQSVTCTVVLRSDSNYVTLYTLIKLPDRQICSVNIVNKYVVLRKN